MNRLRCKLYDLSSSGKLVSYDKVWRYQKALVEQAGQQYKSSNSSTDAIILVQHPSVYTLGRGATPDNIKFRVDSSCPHKVFRVERGGEATWHGPGQLVAYPILNLNQHKRDLHWLTDRLEETVIKTLLGFGVKGERSAVNTGVWVGKNKISAVGLTASRWVTMHGMALNVNCDLANFEQIIPCGIAQSDRGVASLQQLYNTFAGHLSGESFAVEDPSLVPDAEQVDINLVAAKWMQSFSEVFNLDIQPVGQSDPEENYSKAVEELDGIADIYLHGKDVQLEEYRDADD